MFPASELLVEKELFKNYVTLSFGSRESYAKKGSKDKRKLWMKNFDNAIIAWLDKNNPHSSPFMQIDDLYHRDVAFTNVQRNVMEPDDNCDLNNVLYIECGGTCGNCTKQQSSKKF